MAPGKIARKGLQNYKYSSNNRDNVSIICDDGEVVVAGQTGVYDDHDRDGNPSIPSPK